MSTQQEKIVELGRGRSGIVFIDRDFPQMIRKVFFGSTLTDLVHYFFSGAPNPYMWNKNAIYCAYWRRIILSHLTKHWFAEKLSVANAIKVSWNKEHRAYELWAELVKGREAKLHHPFYQEKELETLVFDIMRPLQHKLKISGFDGLVWQAGLGNPVAANNFLWDEQKQQWVWIDLESGVPALIPLNFMRLLDFYLPKSFRHRRALFDDVDIKKLRQYIAYSQQSLMATIGKENISALENAVSELEIHQSKWRNLRRIQRPIQYHLGKEKITPKQAQFFLLYPFLWYPKEFLRLFVRAWTKVFKLPGKLIRYFFQVPYKKIFVFTWRFLCSQKYRAGQAKMYVAFRIKAWEKRKKLGFENATKLRTLLVKGGESSSYITDFGVHIAIKPFIKSIEYWVVPALYLLGVVSASTVIIVAASGGSLGRTLYTLGRLIQASVAGEEKPWIALWVGIFPIVGNFAYPLQMVISAREDKIAAFVLYDTVTSCGQAIPIWGGKDTLTEHFFNRLPNMIVKGKNT